MADCLNNEEAINSQLSSTNTDAVSSNLDVDNGVSSELIGSNDMTSNIEGEETTTSLLNEEEPLDSVLDQSTTSKYTGGETDNIVVSVDNLTHTITATLKPIKFKTVADFPVVGSDRLLYIDATENSLYSWDSDLGEYRKLVADTGDVEIDLDDYYKKTETDARYGASIEFGIDNSTYIITAQLKDANGNNLGVAKTIDLPLESVVVNGSYDSTTKEVVLTLDNGSEIKFSVADLVSGLQTEITTTNKLASDLVDDTNSVNKFVTQDEKDKLEGIEAGANKTVVDDAFSLISTNPVQNKLVYTALSERVSTVLNQTIDGVKTFNQQPKIADSVTENTYGRNYISAGAIRQLLTDYQEKLIEGTNIRIDGNTISADLSGSAPIVVLESPVYIWNLSAGVFKLPENCELYYNSSSSLPISYRNSGSAMLIVSTTEAPTNAYKDYKRFYLFAPEIGQAENFGSTFISGRANETQGYHETVGASVHIYGDEIISGTKTFQETPQLSRTLATDLNDDSIVNAQWVQSLLAGKGYITEIPSEYVTETELAGKGYLTSVPSEYVTDSELNAKGYLTSVPSEYVTETELTNKGYATQSSLNSTNSTVSSLSSTVSSHTSSINTLSKRYVTQTYVSGTTWYTIYNDGWKECGLQGSRSGNYYNITLPVTFSNTNYTALYQAREGSEITSTNTVYFNTGSRIAGNIISKTTNSMKLQAYYDNCHIYCCGY